MFAVTTGLPACEGGRDQLPGRLDAADDLDDEVDVRVVDDVEGVAGEDAGAELDVAVARQVADGDPGDLQLDAGARLDLLGLGGDEADERGADVAAPEDADADDAATSLAGSLGSHPDVTAARLRLGADLLPVR